MKGRRKNEEEILRSYLTLINKLHPTRGGRRKKIEKKPRLLADIFELTQ